MSELAKSGRTVILTIHQPRSDIFELFDLMTILSGLSVGLFVCLPACCIFVCESVCLFVCVSVSLHVCLPFVSVCRHILK